MGEEEALQLHGVDVGGILAGGEFFAEGIAKVLGELHVAEGEGGAHGSEEDEFAMGAGGELLEAALVDGEGGGGVAAAFVGAGEGELGDPVDVVRSGEVGGGVGDFFLERLGHVWGHALGAGLEVFENIGRGGHQADEADGEGGLVVVGGFAGEGDEAIIELEALHVEGGDGEAGAVFVDELVGFFFGVGTGGRGPVVDEGEEGAHEGVASGGGSAGGGGLEELLDEFVTAFGFAGFGVAGGGLDAEGGVVVGACGSGGGGEGFVVDKGVFEFARGLLDDAHFEAGEFEDGVLLSGRGGGGVWELFVTGFVVGDGFVEALEVFEAEAASVVHDAEHGAVFGHGVLAEVFDEDVEGFEGFLPVGGLHEFTGFFEEALEVERVVVDRFSSGRRGRFGLLSASRRMEREAEEGEDEEGACEHGGRCHSRGWDSLRAGREGRSSMLGLDGRRRGGHMGGFKVTL